jgi:DNA-directed RNA polymerase specialized sigma subunit
MTGIVENVEVTKEIYDVYRRLGYNANYRERKAVRNEILFSHLIGGGEGGIDNFHEFRLDGEDPQLILDNNKSMKELKNALGKLTDEEVRLLLTFFISGKSERRFAAEQGLSQMTFRYRKEKVLKKLRQLLLNK